VAGTYGGRRLDTPPGWTVRPTADRVKEALFSILTPRLVGARVLDAFAGTGALGIEALSRGADRVDFLESDPAVIRVLTANLEGLGNPPGAVIHRGNALHPHAWGGVVLPVDLILADPPYAGGVAQSFLEALSPEGAITRGGVLVLEHSASEVPRGGSWARTDGRRYGDTMLSFYGRATD